jgi:hypothetical protein
MADSKITALTALTAADPVNDMFPVVDVSDTTMAASGTTKKISVNNILSSSPTASGALTVTGLVTAGSATITGAATVGTTLGVTNSFTVGTGANSAVQKAAILGGYTVFENSAGTGNPSITFNNDIDTGILNNGANVLQFNTAGVERARFNQTGAFVLYGGTAAASGIGIAFPTTQVDSSDANTLDDYEEGTWTGTLKGATTDPTIAVTATGRYTKVGRQVSVQIFISNVVTTGASGRISIAGLPFSNNSTTAAVGTTGFYDMATFTGSPFGETAPTGTTVEMYSSISNSAYGSVTHNAGIGRYMWMNLTYTV